MHIGIQHPSSIVSFKNYNVNVIFAIVIFNFRGIDRNLGMAICDDFLETSILDDYMAHLVLAILHNSRL